MLKSVFVPLDDDECLKTPPVCDVNANCKNTLGSYLCSCIEGFTGDGKTCQGKILKKIVLQFFAYLGHSQIRIRILRFVYRGYYMATWGYEFYFRVLKVSLTSERSERVRDTFSTRR